jgi:hypothetical protein
MRRVTVLWNRLRYVWQSRDTPHDSTEGARFSTASVDNSWPDEEDVVREATTEEMSQAVFSASPLGALGNYISRLTNAEKICVVRQ